MLKRVALLLGLLSGPAFAQTPTPAQLGLVVATPNVVQVLDSTKHWSSIGTIDPGTHAFTPTNAFPEAPNDSTTYGRRVTSGVGAWAHITHNDITDWSASVPPAYSLPVASTTVLGGVKVDGTTITATGGGVISATASGGGTPGGSPGQVQYNNAGAFGGFTASGDATINTGTGAVAVTKTGGTAFGALATVAPGTGVATAAAAAANTNGGMALVNGSPVVGNSLKWSATGVQDGGAFPSTSVQRFTALASLSSATAVCQINGCTPTGSGYSGASGTLTLTTNSGKFVCSTYPVLNVVLTGATVGTPTVATAGSCTVMGGTADEVWTPGGSLVGGSGALFALTWAATAQTYTPTSGLKYAMIYAYGAGSQAGGGASTVSGTGSSGGAAGGGGSMNQCFVSAAQIGGSQTVTVGLGGRSGGNPSQIATGPGTIGQIGGVTTIGSLCKGWNGGAGFGGINAATLSGGGSGGGMGVAGVSGASAQNGFIVTSQCSTAGFNGVTPPPNPCGGGGSGGASGNANGSAILGLPGALGGAGGASGGGLTTGPAATFGQTGGAATSQGIPLAGGAGGSANGVGLPGANYSTIMPNDECGSAGGGGGSGLTNTVGGNGGAGGLCSGGGGAGSVVNGATSAPGFGGPGGDGVLDVVEFH